MVKVKSDVAKAVSFKSDRRSRQCSGLIVIVAVQRLYSKDFAVCKKTLNAQAANYCYGM